MGNIRNNTRRGIACILTIAAVAGTVPGQQRSASKSNESASKAKSKSENTKSTKGTSGAKPKSSASKTGDPASSSAAMAAANRIIDPRAFDERLLSQLIFDLTNVERKRAGLSELNRNQYLATAATNHSRDMASRNYFNHKSKGIFNRTDHSDRIASTGYRPRTSAENIAMIPTLNSYRTMSYSGGQQMIDADHNTYQRLAVYALQQWMNSPGHRVNIMNRNFTDLGIGVAIGMQGNIPYVYLTQNFGG